MIGIDHEKCTGCGLCSKVCSQGNGNIVVHEKAEIISQDCQRCGQCIEVCPAHAIDWDITATELKEIRQMPDSRSFGDVIINRKSIRNYLRRPIDTEILEHLIRVAQNTPTAGNCRELRITIIQKEKDRFVKQVIEAYRSFFITHTEAEIISFFGGEKSYYDKWERYIGAFDDSGSDEVMFGAPAAVLISGTERFLPDAGMMAQSMVLLAQTYGLGSCYVGFMRRAAKISEDYRTFLKLKEQEEILAGFTLGYPSVHYKRNIDKEPFEVLMR